MKKWRLFLTLSAEEAWINGVQMQGYRLARVSAGHHRYTFEPLPATATFNPATRLDFRDGSLSKRAYRDYQQLFLDSGWQLIRGSRYGGIQYFQQTRATADDDIFSDKLSKGLCRSRDQRMGMIYGGIFLVWFVTFGLENRGLNGTELWNFRSWYLRPGLWQMPSDQFWPAFWFETPFALLRGGVPFIFLLISVYYFARAFSTMRSNQLDD